MINNFINKIYISKKKFIFYFLFFILFSNNAYAYLDPGSINIFLQIVAALLSAFFILIGSVNSFIKYVLEKKQVNTILLVILSIFPIWLFKSSFNFNWLLIYLIIIFCIPFFLITFFLRNVDGYYFSGNLTIIQNFVISSIILYGLDQHIGLWEIVNYFISRGRELYIVAIILIISLWILTSYLVKRSYIKYLFILLVVTFSYNLFSQDKNLKKIESTISFNNYADSNLMINVSREEMKPILFIILDEMNGIGSLDKVIQNYEKAKKSYLDIVNTHNFTIYPNSYTMFSTTSYSVSRMLNFDTSLTDPNNDNYVTDHDEYFFTKKLLKNKFFDSLDNKKIYVKQSRGLDYCNNINVVRCDTFNPLSKNILKEINYFNPILSEFISKFTYQNSIFARFLSRFLVELNLINLSNSPRTNKAYFEKDLSKLFEVIKNEKYDLYFAHFLVPHKPFGFDKECNYKNFAALNFDPIFMKTQHNNEIYCTNLFLNNFLNRMKKLANYNNFKIIIVSDHGARNSSKPKDYYSVATLVKDSIQQPYIDKKIVSVQHVISEFFNQVETNNSPHNKYYDADAKKFVEVKFD
jgi:hypothetical protein